MLELIMGISQYAKNVKPGFIVITQNGMELVSSNGDESGQPHTAYRQAIDANGQKDSFYGYDHDDKATSPADHAYLKGLLDIPKNAGKIILVTDYCYSPSKMTKSYLS